MPTSWREGKTVRYDDLMRPFLTIITVTYNAEAFLEKTLLSAARAFGQLPEGVATQYLLMDGVSTDRTLDIAERFRQELRLEVYSEPDKGLYDAMNKGLSRASGRYLWFLNAGDEVHDDEVLKNLVNAMSSDADIYYSDALFISPEGAALGLRSRVTPHSLPRTISWKDMALGMKICHQAFIARKELVPRYRTDNLSADLDWEITALKKASKIELLDFVLCKYLLGGLSARQRKKSLADRWRVLKEHFGAMAAVINHVRIGVRGVLFTIRKGKYW